MHELFSNFNNRTQSSRRVGWPKIYWKSYVIFFSNNTLGSLGASGVVLFPLHVLESPLGNFLACIENLHRTPNCYHQHAPLAAAAAVGDIGVAINGAVSSDSVPIDKAIDKLSHDGLCIWQSAPFYDVW